MSRQKARAEPNKTSRWFSRLFSEPATFFTAIAALAAAASAIYSSIVTSQVREEQRLSNAPALYLQCTQIPGHAPPPGIYLYYQIFDPRDYPGAVNEGIQSELSCKLTNISTHSEVHIRVGFLAVFYDAKGKSKLVNYRTVVLPDDAIYFSYGEHAEGLNLAPQASATFILPNGAPESLILVPATQAEVSFPGDPSVRCADVYTAPGTLQAMRADPMPSLPPKYPKSSAPAIPTVASSDCINLDAASILRPGQNLAGKPNVYMQGVLKGKGQSVTIQLPNF